MSTLNGRNITTVAAKTAAYTILATENKTIFTNEGAGAARLFSLPAATVGLEFRFHVMAAFELQIDPSGTETIALPSSGAQGAAGKYLGADAVGEWVHLVCVKAGQWQVMGYAGTWTAES